MSLIKANAIQTTGGKPILNSTGSIIQVTSSYLSSTFTTSSTSAVDIGLSCSITPTSPTNKILVCWSINYTMYGHADLYLLRNGSKIYFGDLYGSQTQSSHHGYGSSSYGNDYGHVTGSAVYLDSPNTTSSLTYKWQGAVPWSSSYVLAINYSRPNENNAYNSRTASSMTLMEVTA